MAGEPGGPRTGQVEPDHERWKLSELEELVLFTEGIAGIDTDPDYRSRRSYPGSDFLPVTHKLHLAAKFLAQFVPADQISEDQIARQAQEAQRHQAQLDSLSAPDLASIPHEFVDLYRTCDTPYTRYSRPFVDINHVSPAAIGITNRSSDPKSVDIYYAPGEVGKTAKAVHPYTIAVKCALEAAEQGRADLDQVLIAIAIIDADEAVGWGSAGHGGGTQRFADYLETHLAKYELALCPEISQETYGEYLQQACPSYTCSVELKPV